MRINTEIKYGQLREIANKTGYSYDYVRRVIVYGNRSNAKIIELANIIAQNNKELEKKLTAA